MFCFCSANIRHIACSTKFLHAKLRVFINFFYISLTMNDLDVKKIREELNISQEALADMVGVHPRTVQNWEAGSTIPKSKHAILRSLLEENHTNNSPISCESETNRLISLLEKSQKQIDAHISLLAKKDEQIKKKDEQMDRLIGLLEKK